MSGPNLERVHLIGIGGAGMSGIARILLARGAQVSGSDAKPSTTLSALRALGARCEVGHQEANLGDAATVVYSSAIRPTNPELAAARAQGRAVLPRAAALAALMSGRRSVCVAGTHGKTTTTSMLVVALQAARADPSFAIGADLNEVGSNAHEGSGALFVAEADESDGSFLLLRPDLAIVTNVDADHLDFYGQPEAVAAAFVRFAELLGPDGLLVACADDPGSRRLAAQAQAAGIRTQTYGESGDADLHLTEVQVRPDGTEFCLTLGGRRLGEVRLPVVGRHNALDAAGALAAGLALDQPFESLCAGLAQFRGARRRFEHKGDVAGIAVVDDYAHNPAKVAAALTAARVVAGAGRLLVAFQPHLYSRTARFAAEFGQALGLADEVVVLEVYAAREDPLPGVSGELVAAAIPLDADRVRFEPFAPQAAQWLADRAEPGDLVLTVGAGDVTLLGPMVLELLAERYGR